MNTALVQIGITAACLAACGGKHETAQSSLPSNQAPLTAATTIRPNTARDPAMAACSETAASVSAIAMMECYADNACRCVTRDCATAINDDMTKWGQDMSTGVASSAPPTKADQSALTKAALRYSECISKLMAADPANGSAATGGSNP